jgi:hypothetical protein
MEAATACVFLLLRFVSASASASVAFSRVRLITCLLPTHAFSGFSLLHDRRLPAKLRGEKNAS